MRITAQPDRIFCNPTSKIHEFGESDIQDPDAHLTFYPIELSPDSEELILPPQVSVSNQFGDDQQLQLLALEVLAVPTNKLAIDSIPTGHNPPGNLDHFKCYVASGPTPDVNIVGLSDEFFPVDPVDNIVFLGAPFMLCNPVQKTVVDAEGEHVTPIRNPEEHLVCYEAEDDNPRPPHILDIENQFGGQTLQTLFGFLLCVPSTKTLPTPPTGEGKIVINEVDYDQPTTDTEEFIELFNSGTGPIDLTNLQVELVNGNGDVVYATYNLGDAGANLPAGGYLVIGSSAILGTLGGCCLTIPLIPDTNGIQNGFPDGVRIVDGLGGFIDGLAYEGSMPGTGEGTEHPGESGSPDSVCRIPNGADTDDNSVDFSLCSPTPGGFNGLPP